MNHRTNVRISSLNDKGLPSTRQRPSLGDMCLSPSLTDPGMYDQWIWAGDTLEWQKLGIVQSFDEERLLREQRVSLIKEYFDSRRHV